MEAVPPALTLGHEELVLLLWLMKVPSLPGLPVNPFGDVPSEQAAAGLSAADRSLRARGLIQVDAEGNVALDQVAVALLGTCAIPEASVAVRHERGEQLPTVRYYHCSQDMAVEHSNPEAGVHHFRALPGAEAVPAEIAAVLQLGDQPAPPCPAGLLPQDLLRQATEQARDGHEEEARKYLQGEGLEGSFAAALATTLSQPLAKSTIAALHGLRGEAPASEVLVILEGANGLWLMREEKAGQESRVRMLPCSAAEARERLVGLIAGQTGSAA